MTLDPDEVKPETWAIVGGRPEPVPGAPLNTPMSPPRRSCSAASASTAATRRPRAGRRSRPCSAASRAAMRWRSRPGWRRAQPCSVSLPPVRTWCSATTATRAWPGSPRPAPGTTSGASSGCRSTDPRWMQRASEADLLWLESPSNPLLEVADLAAICAAPRGAADARRGRQHVRHAAAPAPARARGRHRRALGDQADRRAFRPAARRGGHRRRRGAAAAAGGPGPERGHAGDARVLPCPARLADARRCGCARPRRRPRELAAAAGRACRRRPGALPRVRDDRELRARRRRRSGPGLPRHPDHPPRDEPRRRRDVHGAAQRPPGPGAHPARPDPAQHRLRGSRGCVERPRAALAR